MYASWDQSSPRQQCLSNVAVAYRPIIRLVTGRQFHGLGNRSESRCSEPQRATASLCQLFARAGPEALHSNLAWETRSRGAFDRIGSLHITTVSSGLPGRRDCVACIGLAAPRPPKLRGQGGGGAGTSRLAPREPSHRNREGLPRSSGAALAAGPGV